jgi:O-antigen/teichoic acid export membrane protein
MINKLKDLLFTNRGAKQTIVKNVFWLSIGQIGSRLIRAVIIIYAARILGAAEYGIFSYVLGLAGFFTIFADLGVSPLMTREIAGHPEKKSVYFANALWVKTILISLTAALIIFLAPKFSNIKEAVALLPFVALLTFFDNLRDFIFAYFRGIEKMEREAFLVVIMNTTIALTGFIVLSFYKTAGALLFSYITSVVVLSIVALYFIKGLVREIFKNFDKAVFKQFIRDCWPLAFTSLFGIFMLNVDVVMLGWWRTPEEIGYYSASQRIVQILYTLPAILASAVFPAMSRFIKNKDHKKLRLINEKSTAAVYFAAVPIAIGGIVLSGPIIEFVFGKEYLPASTSFQILIATVLIQFPSSVLGGLIMAHNQQKRLFKYAGIGSISNIVFNALLIPVYGIAGSAIATFIAQIAYFGPVWLKLKQIENFQTLRHLKKIIIAGIVMGISGYALNRFLELNVFINIIFSIVIYLGALYLLKEEIINEIRGLFKKIKG